MLAQLNIRNLAVIDEVELDFAAGMTVLTGETGAGKSILVDALALALGERGDSSAIRTGAERCEITAEFDVRDRPDLRGWLRDNDLDEDEDCILRRVVNTDGRSRGYINGRSVPMQTLREIGERLVDICGQQAHQSLRHPQAQRTLLDQFGGHERLLQQMRASHDEWSEAQTAFATLQAAQEDRATRLDLLDHQVRELDALQPLPEEFAELEREHKLAANRGRISAGVAQSLERLYDAEANSAYSILTQARGTLDELREFDAELDAAAGMLAEAEILVAEAADGLRQRLDTLEHDPAEEARVEQRMSGYHELARKHRTTPTALADLWESLADELTELRNSDERLDALEARKDECERRLLDAAVKLTKARQKTARKLSQQVTHNMQSLGMPDGTFEIDVQAVTDKMPGGNGRDRIEFLTAANPGQAPGPLTKVASGGELSRISLSLQVVAMAAEAVPTLIFDEVDAGVGGGVAEIVGARLLELSAQRQVLCVTHLAQVASQARQHLRVSKISDGNATRTTVSPLAEPARIEEIARMLGGVEITARTRAHAKEMLQENRARKAG